MSRDMIGANKAVFNKIYQYCRDFNVTILNTTNVRFIKTDDDQKTVLKHLKVLEKYSFSNDKLLLFIQVNSIYQIVTIDFALFDEIPGFSETTPCAGMATALLASEDIFPSSSPNEIKDVIEIGHFEDGDGYDGHRVADILPLYPSMRVLEHADELGSAIWYHFLTICIQECKKSRNWMNDELLVTLSQIAVDEPTNIPLPTICRSIFDTDPGALFLSLYRCLEGIYVHDVATQIKREFSLTASWKTIATKLETIVNWRPNELSSLEKLVKKGENNDYSNILSACNVELYEDSDAAKVSAKNIYKIRNELVHYRPIHQTNSADLNYDWNKLCIGMSGLVRKAYQHVTLD